MGVENSPMSSFHFYIIVTIIHHGQFPPVRIICSHNPHISRTINLPHLLACSIQASMSIETNSAIGPDRRL